MAQTASGMVVVGKIIENKTPRPPHLAASFLFRQLQNFVLLSEDFFQLGQPGRIHIRGDLQHGVRPILTAPQIHFSSNLGRSEIGRFSWRPIST